LNVCERLVGEGLDVPGPAPCVENDSLSGARAVDAPFDGVEYGSAALFGRGNLDEVDGGAGLCLRPTATAERKKADEYDEDTLTDVFGLRTA
jgi:hypothetical protein